MKKEIVIISTYPEHGSKNIGDMLISEKLKTLVSEFIDCNYTILWRADSWENVRASIMKADHVFFACLAIRPNMHSDQYPYLKDVAESGTPFSVISAGTDLQVHSLNTLFCSFSKDTIDLLRQVNAKAVVNTTRGYLTQELCENLDLDSFTFSGDVAFYAPANAHKGFESHRPIKKIVLSDPHRSEKYLNAFRTLHEGVKSLFPAAEITVAQHGVNPLLDEFCRTHAIRTVRTYEEPETGLELYDSADLHVGFRVHAHVSALSRRVYSYLLEQDGRGCDYGLTIDRKISVPCYPSLAPSFTVKGMLRILIRGTADTAGKVSVAPAEELIALLRMDLRWGFRRFAGLEEQLNTFDGLLREAVGKALSVSQ